MKMVKRSKSDINLTNRIQKPVRLEKQNDPSLVKGTVAKMNSLVKCLEYSLEESEKNEMKLRKQLASKESLKNQSDEAKKENKQLLNVLQQQSNFLDVPRSGERSDVSRSFSTISMVHLQYKYEELLSSHEGLLKLLEAKVREVRKCYRENEKMDGEIKSLRLKLGDYEDSIKSIYGKFKKMKERKDKKIKELKFERDAIKLAHDKLVRLLQNYCMESDEALHTQLSTTPDCLKSLLINEVRKSNKLKYENVILSQSNCYLKARVEKKFNLE